MRGIYTPVVKIRRQIFKKVAQIAYSGEFDKVDELPYEIIKGEVASYRESVFKERAIVAERIRLACGLNLRSAGEHAPISKDFERQFQQSGYLNSFGQCDPICLQCM